VQGAVSVRSDDSNGRNHLKQYLISGSTIENVNGYYEGNSLDLTFFKDVDSDTPCLLWWDEGRRTWTVTSESAILVQTHVMEDATTPLELEWFDAKLVAQRDMKIEDVTGQERASNFQSSFKIQGTRNPKIDGFYTGDTFDLMFVKYPDGFDGESRVASFKASRPWVVDRTVKRKMKRLSKKIKHPSFLWYDEENRRWLIVSQSVPLAQSEIVEPATALRDLEKLSWELEGTDLDEPALVPGLEAKNSLKVTKLASDWHLFAEDKYCGTVKKKRLISGQVDVTIKTCQQYALRDHDCGPLMFSDGKRACSCVLEGEKCGDLYDAKNSMVYIDRNRKAKKKKQGKCKEKTTSENY